MKHFHSTAEKHVLLKNMLMIQSFSPLFLLLFIRYADFTLLHRITLFCTGMLHSPMDTLYKTMHSTVLIPLIVNVSSIVMVILGIVVFFYFHQIQQYDVIDRGEYVKKTADLSENSMGFFATYIVPLLMDDIDKPRGFFCFLVILIITILLMNHTNLYYQNPILSALGYKTFQFTFTFTTDAVLADKECIAITKGYFDENKIIQRTHIADNVYIIYNKN